MQRHSSRTKTEGAKCVNQLKELVNAFPNEECGLRYRYDPSALHTLVSACDQLLALEIKTEAPGSSDSTSPLHDHPTNAPLLSESSALGSATEARTVESSTGRRCTLPSATLSAPFSPLSALSATLPRKNVTELYGRSFRKVSAILAEAFTLPPATTSLTGTSQATTISEAMQNELQNEEEVPADQARNPHEGHISLDSIVALTAQGAEVVCGKNYGMWEFVARCYTCGLDPTCIMCIQCFMNSPCVHHRHFYCVSMGGGMCDCGDPHSWKAESFCTHHRPAAEGDSSGGVAPLHSIEDTAILEHLPPMDREWVFTVVRCHVQYLSMRLLQLLHHTTSEIEAAAEEKEGSSHPPQNITKLSPPHSGANTTALDPPQNPDHPNDPNARSTGKSESTFAHLRLSFPVDLVPLAQNLSALAVKGGGVGRHLLAIAWKEPLQHVKPFQPVLPPAWCRRQGMPTVPHVTCGLDVLFLLYTVMGKGFDEKARGGSDSDDGDEEGEELNDDNIEEIDPEFFGALVEGDGGEEDVPEEDEEGGSAFLHWSASGSSTSMNSISTSTSTADEDNGEETPGQEERSVEADSPPSSGWELLDVMVRESMSCHSFRMLYGMINIKYLPHKPNGAHFENIQVLANSAVVDSLLLPPSLPVRGPSGSPASPTDTIVHRFLTHMLYLVSYHSVKPPVKNKEQKNLPYMRIPLELRAATHPHVSSLASRGVGVDESTTAFRPVVSSFAVPSVCLPISTNAFRRTVYHTFSMFDSILLSSRSAAALATLSRTSLRAISVLVALLQHTCTISATLALSANSPYTPSITIILEEPLRDCLRSITQEVYAQYQLRADTKAGEEARVAYLDENRRWLQPLQRSRRLDRVDAPIDRQTPEFRALMAAVELQPEEHSLLGFQAPSEAEVLTFSSSQAYLNDILEEISRAMRCLYVGFWEKIFTQRDFTVANDIPSLIPKMEWTNGHSSAHAITPVYPYDISRHGFVDPVMLMPLLECFCADVLACQVVQDALEEDANADDPEYPKPFWRMTFRKWNHPTLHTSMVSPLKAQPGIAFLESRSRIELDGLLDSVVMKFVLDAQVAGSMWNALCSSAEVHLLFHHGAQYIFLLQLLASVYSPEDFAIRLLERFSFSSQSRSMERSLPGNSAFLWLIGSILMTPVSKTLTMKENLEEVQTLVANFLAVAPRMRSKVQSFVSRYRHQYGEVLPEEDFRTIQSQAIDTVACVRGNSTIWTLKNTAAWDHVHRYHYTMRSAVNLKALHDSYTSLVNRENFTAEEEGRPKREPRVPPAEFGCDIDVSASPAWRACARDVLHTPAVLQVCLLELLRFTVQLKLHQQNEAGENSGVTPIPAPQSFLDALQLLYLGVKDAALISKTMINWKRRSAGEPLILPGEELPSLSPSSPLTATETMIDWEAVKEFLQAHVWNTCNYNDHSVETFLPLRRWKSSCRSTTAAPCSNETKAFTASFVRPVPSEPSTTAPCTIAELLTQWIFPKSHGSMHPLVFSVAGMLKELFDYYQQNPKEDGFSYADMLRYILLASRSVISSAGVGVDLSSLTEVESPNQQSEEESRRKKRKERQAELLKKFRMQKKKKIGDPGMAEKEVKENAVDLAWSRNSEEAELNSSPVAFMDVLLIKMLDRKCHICGTDTEEHLQLLATAVESPVLSSLSPQPKGHTKFLPRTQLHSCGHVAHRSCMETFWEAQARSVYRRVFMAEQRVCMICRTPFHLYLPLPKMEMPQEVGEKDSKNNALLVQWRGGRAVHAPVLLRERVVYAEQEKAAQQCKEENEIRTLLSQSLLNDPLKPVNEKAWMLAGTLNAIQAELELEMEFLKCGGEIRDSFLMGVFSVLLTFDVADVKEQETVLRARFQERREDFAELLLDVFLATQSEGPHHAVPMVEERLAAYTARMLRWHPSMQQLVERLLTSDVSVQEDPLTPEHVSLWASLGVLTLLRLLTLAKSPSSLIHGVVELQWPPEKISSSLLERATLITFHFPTLQSSLLNHPHAGPLSEAIRRMLLCLLQPSSVGHPSTRQELLASVHARWSSSTSCPTRALEGGTAASELWCIPVKDPCCPTESKAEWLEAEEQQEVAQHPLGPAAWQRWIRSEVLHLPKHYIDYVADFYSRFPRWSGGTASDASWTLPARCLYCKEWLHAVTLQNRQLVYNMEMLTNHGNQCCGPSGLYLLLHFNLILFMDAKHQKCSTWNSPYLTECGEQTENTVSGVLTLDRQQCETFIHRWMLQKR